MIKVFMARVLCLTNLELKNLTLLSNGGGDLWRRKMPCGESWLCPNVVRITGISVILKFLGVVCPLGGVVS